MPSVRRILLAALFLLLLAPGPAQALITGGFGNDPVPDRNWRTGSLDLANRPSRVGYWEGPPFGGGQYNFLYRGDTVRFTEALGLFAMIRAPELQLHIHDGPHEEFWLKATPDAAGKVAEPSRDARVDWTFTIWDAVSFHQLNNNPNSPAFLAQSPDYRERLPAPRLDVYIGGGQIDWSKVSVPPGLRVTDHRASALGVKPEDGAVVMGSVYDLATSKVLPNATISVSSRAQAKPSGEPVITARADDAGRFRIEKLTPGPVQIIASAPGYASRVVAYDSLSAHDARSYDVELAPEGTVTGRVLSPDGKPLPDAQINCHPIGADGRGYTMPSDSPTKSDADGRFELKGLPTGFCQLSFFATGYSAKWDPTLHPIPAKDVVLQAVATGSLKGTVVDPSGKPARGGSVNIQDAAGAKVGTWGGSMNVKPDGTFAFTQFPEGRYVISTKPFLPGQPADASAQTLDVKAGEVADVRLVAKP